MTILIATKLHQPVSRTNIVQRPHLIQRLNAGLSAGHQVLLVSAPAGFGKTTCVGEWVNTLDGWPVTWLSADTEDDDPGRFFSYLIAALQKVDADLGQEIESVLRSGQLPPGEIISTTLINDILELEDRFVLVLEDFHVIQDHFILKVLENLVTNLPPQLHLVFVTREDPPLPLAQLRANNKLTEIRAKELRFSSPDIERFLVDIMDLSLSDADIKILEEKTEGWIVGLQLASLSIRDRDNPSGFITTLTGSHRHILSYLTEEVLNRQPKDIQQFLLQTSILDKLNGDLCNAITERSDGSALLEQIFNANLFLVPLDDEGQWYRYHHLFADLLRTRQENITAENHLRASHWYARAGMMSEAIQHAISAEDYPLAVSLLENHAMGMIMQGYTKTVNDWVEMIPEQWRSQSPRTNLAFAWMYLLRGAYTQASPYLERLQENFGDSQSASETVSPSLMAEWFAMQSLMLHRQGKWEESKHTAVRALEIAPDQDSHVRSLAYYAMASACWQLDDYTSTVETYQMAIHHSRMGDNLLAEMLSTVALAGLLLEHGQLHQAFEIASQAVERIERTDVLHPVSAVVYAALGDAYYQWHQVEEARYYLQRALHLSTLGGTVTVTVFCHTLLARQFQIEENLDAATKEIQTAVDMLPVEAPESTWREVIVQQVSIYLACNRFAAAEMTLQRYGFLFGKQFIYPDFPPGNSVPNSLGRLYNSGLRVLLYQAQAGKILTDLKLGIELTNQLIPRAFEGKQLLVALEAILLRAQMHVMVDNPQASQVDYVKALELAEPESFISIFVEHGQPVQDALGELVKRNQLGKVKRDYVKCILDAFSSAHLKHHDKPASVSSAGSGPMALVDPLTDRELDVLHLMTEGLKYKEIAEKLFISQNTVRFHVKAIYGKLSVNNRTQAIERGRQLQIL